MNLKLFVWRGVLTDYTYGVAFALAASAEDAKALLIEKGLPAYKFNGVLGVLMPKTITKTVYTFKELIEAAKDPDSDVTSRAVDKARALLQEWATDHNWWEFVYEDWKTALEQVGFADAEIQFSGFWSPGDGASFTAWLNVEKLIKFLSTDIDGKNCVDVDSDYLPLVVHKLCERGHGKRTRAEYADLVHVSDYISGNVERGRYGGNSVHENTCHVTLEYQEPDDEVLELLASICLDGLVEDFEKDVEELRKDLCKLIYRALEEEYNYRTADEQLIEDSEAHGYYFDESGDYEI